MVTNNMRPIHPGEILREEMKELGLSARCLAKALGVPVNRITSIVRKEENMAEPVRKLPKVISGRNI